MSKLAYQYDILNLTPANAQPVEANFTRIEQHVNQELVERDGSVAMRAPLKLPGDPIADLDAAPKQYVDQVIPVGLVMMWGAAAAPTNGKWLLCDGTPLQTAQYPELFAVIGYSWGGSGGTFNPPNLNGKVPLGVGAGHPMAQTGGSENSSLPAHTHTINHDHGGGSTSSVDINHLHAGADHAHGVSINTAAAGVHHHVVALPSSRGFLVSGIGADAGDISDVTGSRYGFVPATSDEGSHAHSVNGGTGLADRGLNTGWMDRNNPHSHTASVPAFNGSTAQAGVAPTGTNMPPFLAISFIIRCK